MNKNVFGLSLLVFSATIMSSCGSGSLLVQPPLPSSEIVATQAGATGRVWAPAGTADAGTTVRIASGGSGEGTVADDGSFLLDAVWTAGAPSTSLEYVDNGFTVFADLNPARLEDRVTKPYFSTGQAPNDMLYFSDALYVANSLDNTVTSYSLDGSQTLLAGFPQFASPSFLAAFHPAPESTAQLLVACNGDNTLSPLLLSNLSSAGSPWQLEQTADPVAFMGPGRPVFAADRIFVPRAQIASFGPTSYGPGLLSAYSASGNQLGEITSVGTNCSACAYDPLTTRLYLVSAGDQLFDESFHPYVTTDSLLEVFDPATLAPIGSPLNLGRTGAASIALSADGNFAYIASLLRAEIYKVDLDSMTVLRGEDNPIVLSSEFSFVSDLELAEDGTLWATSFNTDELCAIDTDTDTINPGPYAAPFDLALDPQLLSGAAGVELAPSPTRAGKQDAYVLLGVGNAVAKVELF